MPVFDEEDQSTWGAYKLQLGYLKWLANEAHTRALAIALKNNLEQVCVWVGVGLCLGMWAWWCERGGRVRACGWVGIWVCYLCASASTRQKLLCVRLSTSMSLYFK